MQSMVQDVIPDDCYRPDRADIDIVRVDFDNINIKVFVANEQQMHWVSALGLHYSIGLRVISVKLCYVSLCLLCLSHVLCFVFLYSSFDASVSYLKCHWVATYAFLCLRTILLLSMLHGSIHPGLQKSFLFLWPFFYFQPKDRALNES